MRLLSLSLARLLLLWLLSSYFKMSNCYVINNRTRFHQLSLPRWLHGLALGVITVAATVMPVKAAEKIYFIYTPISLSLRVNSLNTFAQDGEVNKDLGFYLNLVGASEQAQIKFRATLNKPAKLDPILVSRFFNSQIGEDLLTRFGYMMEIQGGRNGKYALRGAMVLAAFDEEGLSLINFFRKLPTNMQIDLRKILTLAKFTEKVVKATKVFSEEEIPRLSEMEAAAAKPVNFDNLPDLRQKGSFGVEQQRWTLIDNRRNRSFYVDVYKPRRWRGDRTPVVIFSHGLSSKPEDFARGGRFLASHGYVVAAPQHIGSDYQHTQAFLKGLSREVFLTDEFIDRPLDISYVIDELERRNQTEFDGQLALDKVGVFGHSFGGYTALAVAGATIDFEHLEQECRVGQGRANVALLLQCRALDLERKPYNLRDERVVAVLAHNPVNRSIFGPKGLSQIKIPVLLGAGSYDPATPFIFEQLGSFTWLTTPDKYLVLQEGEAHVDLSRMDAGVSEMIASVDKFNLPEPQLLHTYSQATKLAFAEVYVANNADYRPYLQSSYLTYLSQGQEFKTYLISNASSEKLTQAIEQFQREEEIEKLIQALERFQREEDL